MALKVGGSLQLTTMDYSDLCWIDFITPTKFDVGFKKVCEMKHLKFCFLSDMSLLTILKILIDLKFKKI